jgi:hypothetical protein
MLIILARNYIRDYTQKIDQKGSEQFPYLKLTASVVYWSEFLATERRCNMFPVRYELNLCYVEESRPPLWSIGQSSWLQIPGATRFSEK